MRLSKRAKALLGIAVGLGLAFIYIPLLVIAVQAFNASKILKWPPPGFTFDWFEKAFESDHEDSRRQIGTRETHHQGGHQEGDGNQGVGHHGGHQEGEAHQDVGHQDVGHQGDAD